MTINYNPKGKYELVDINGNVVDTFRLVFSAINEKFRLKKEFGEVVIVREVDTSKLITQSYPNQSSKQSNKQSHPISEQSKFSTHITQGLKKEQLDKIIYQTNKEINNPKGIISKEEEYHNPKVQGSKDNKV